jgi:hypothetical protein
MLHHFARRLLLGVRAPGAATPYVTLANRHALSRRAAVMGVHPFAQVEQGGVFCRSLQRWCRYSCRQAAHSPQPQRSATREWPSS